MVVVVVPEGDKIGSQAVVLAVVVVVVGERVLTAAYALNCFVCAATFSILFIFFILSSFSFSISVFFFVWLACLLTLTLSTSAAKVEDGLGALSQQLKAQAEAHEIQRERVSGFHAWLCVLCMVCVLCGLYVCTVVCVRV